MTLLDAVTDLINKLLDKASQAAPVVCVADDPKPDVVGHPAAQGLRGSQND